MLPYPSSDDDVATSPLLHLVLTRRRASIWGHVYASFPYEAEGRSERSGYIGSLRGFVKFVESSNPTEVLNFCIVPVKVDYTVSSDRVLEFATWLDGCTRRSSGTRFSIQALYCTSNRAAGRNMNGCRPERHICPPSSAT